MINEPLYRSADSKEGTCENLIKIQLEIIITFGRSIVLIAQKKWVMHEFEARFPGTFPGNLITPLNNDIKFGNYKDSLARRCNIQLFWSCTEISFVFSERKKNLRKKQISDCFDHMLNYVFFISRRPIKIVYKKLIYIDWLILHSLDSDSSIQFSHGRVTRLEHESDEHLVKGSSTLFE